jgi:exopolysaccharide biosynthesis polyprenyl glycosylphosphotransferase
LAVTNIKVSGLRKLFAETLFLAFCLSYVFESVTGQRWTILLQTTSFFFVLTVDITICFVLGYSTTVFDRQRVNLFTTTVIRFLLSLSAIQLINYLLLKERSGLYSPAVLPLALGAACVVSICWHLINFESHFSTRPYRLILRSDLVAIIQKDLSFFAGKLEYFKLDVLKKNYLNSTAIHVVQDAELNEQDLEFLMEKKMSGYTILSISQFYEEILRKIPVDFVSLKDFIFESGFELTSRQLLRRTKRVADLGLSLILLLIAWPIVLVFGLLLRLESKGPVFYSQLRTGENGEVFSIYKLRSMCVDAEVNGAAWAEKNDPRITRIGRIIRVTRIDEIPQLLNVIKGQMSFIGPRPERPEFNHTLAKEIHFYDLRHSVRPGITGWAQVNYPYGSSIEDSKQKLQYDLFYIKNYSLLLDLEILFRTIKVVFSWKGR